MSDFKTANTGRTQQRGPHAFGNMKPDNSAGRTLDEIEAQLEAEGEPLSLAEEIAEQVDAGETDIVHEHYQSVKQGGDIHIAELQKMTTSQLIEELAQREFA